MTCGFKGLEMKNIDMLIQKVNISRIKYTTKGSYNLQLIKDSCVLNRASLSRLDSF